MLAQAFVVEPRICPKGSALPPHDNHVFIYAKVEGLDRAARYLHQDGAWRESTFHNDEPTGYYESEEAAQTVLSQWLQTT